MSPAAGRLGRRLWRHAVASVAVWAASVGVAGWYLRREQPADLRTLPLTDPDSIGLPLVAVGVLVAGLLVVANAAAAAAVLWRRRRSRGAPAA